MILKLTYMDLVLFKYSLLKENICKFKMFFIFLQLIKIYFQFDNLIRRVVGVLLARAFVDSKILLDVWLLYVLNRMIFTNWILFFYILNLLPIYLFSQQKMNFGTSALVTSATLALLCFKNINLYLALTSPHLLFQKPVLLVFMENIHV